MKRIIIALLLTVACTVNGQAHAGILDKIKTFIFGPEKPKPPTIRLLIAEDKPGVTIQVKGRYSLYDPNKNQHLDSRLQGKSKYAQALKGGLRWGEEFPGLFQLKIIPEEPYVTTIVDGIEYRGSIYVYAVDGRVNVVNEVDIEDYLDSILAYEYKKPLNTELLNAIAIAARTNAYFQSVNPKNKFWDVRADQVGYDGFAVTQIGSPIEDAIKNTRYMVLSRTGTYEGVTTPFAARWSTGTKRGQELGTYSTITLHQAENLAINGAHAAQILQKAFPGSLITLVHYESR